MTAYTSPTHPPYVSLGRKRESRRFAVAGLTAIFLIAALVSVYAYLANESLIPSMFQLAVAGFSAYLLLECGFFIRSTDMSGFMAPALLASIVHFFLSYILSGTASYFEPWIFSRFPQLATNDELIKPLLIVWAAAFCMWRGYYLGGRFGRVLRRRLEGLRQIRKSLNPSLKPVVALEVAFIAAVLYAISIGVFGFSSSEEARNQNLGIMDFLNLIQSGGMLALFLLLVMHYRLKEEARRSSLFSAFCLLCVAGHAAIGAISGFKSQIVLPFAIMAFARFVVTRRISVVHAVIVPLTLLAAYQVVEPYRRYLGTNTMFGESTMGSLGTAMADAYGRRDELIRESQPLAVQIASRFDLLGVTAIGVEYSDRGYVKPSVVQSYLESIYLSPVLAFVPRLLWPEKGSYSTGVWFNQVVMHNWWDSATSVGMGPVAWLHIAGGLAGVMLGFFGWGILQGLMFEGFAKAGAGGLIVYLSAIATLVMIPSELGPALTGLLRTLPFAFLVQRFVLLPDLDGLRTRN